MIALLLGLTACTEPRADGSTERPPEVPAAWDATSSVRTADGFFELNFTRPGVVRDGGEDPEVDDALIALIDNAVTRIDLSLFEFDRENVVEAILEAHDRGVEIRFVGDGDELHDDGYEALVAAGLDLSVRNPNDRIMHNKFAVFDDTLVWTGTMNVSENGVMRNNNGTVLIDDPTFAAAYVDEFEQMWTDGNFGRRKETVNPPVGMMLGDHTVSLQFSPADTPDRTMLDALAEADQSVFFLVFSFTREDFASELIALHESGVQVVGVFDESQGRGRYSVDERLAEAGVPVFIDGNKNAIGFAGGKLHHKTLIVDARGSDPTTVVGSYNWSASATDYNDENLVTIEGPEVASAFLDEFCRVLAVATPHPNYVGDVPDPCAGLLVPIRINEFLANPDGTDRGNEWVEIVNAGGAPVDLTGWSLGDRLSSARHVFEPIVLPPGASLVIADSDAVDAPLRQIASTGSLSLNNNSEELFLYDATGTTVDHVEYTGAVSGVSFNRDPDGSLRGGFVLHTALNDGVSTSAGLLASGEQWGTEVLINEAMPNPIGGSSGDEWVELVNIGLAPVDMGGWTIQDNVGARVTFPDGFSLAGGRALLVIENGGNTDGLPEPIFEASGSLSLNNGTENLSLVDAFGLVRAEFGWTSSEQGVSWNRAIDGDRLSNVVPHPESLDDLGQTVFASPGAQVDQDAWGGEIMINEVMPNPDGSDTDNEFVEIVNVGNLRVDISGWTVSDAVSERHVFPNGSVLYPGEVITLYDGGDHSAVPGWLNATTGSLSLNNTGDVVTLRNRTGDVLSALTYGASTSGVSFNRSDDGVPSAGAALHDAVSAEPASPGMRANGALWSTLAR